MEFQQVTVVLPSLNPDGTLCEVVDGLLREGFRDILLVNDGSDEAHREPFERASKHPEVTVLVHEANRGKGAAMKTAFRYILDHRPNSPGAVTVDGDGQHTPKDVRACAERMLSEGDKVILGCRDFSGSDIPWKSRCGNLITRTVFRLFCGIAVSDTQTGLRAIPAAHLPLMLRTAGERYEYETEMFFELKRNHVSLAEQRIETVYEPGNPTSHFHPFRDSIAIYKKIGAFALSSGTSFLVDYLLFLLLNALLRGKLSDGARLTAAFLGARAVSSMVNYLLNKNAVFHSDAPARRTLVKYYLLCVLQAATGAGLLLALSKLLRAGAVLEAVLKLIIDITLFLISFQIQHRWVFR